MMKTLTPACKDQSRGLLRKLRLAWFGLSACSSMATVAAQSLPKAAAPIPYPAAEITKIAKEVRSDGYVYFNDDFEDSPGRVLTERKAAFGLEPSDEMQLLEVQKLDGGIQRYHYRQFHLGVPVEGADFSVYARDKKAHHAAGALAHGLGTSASAGLSEQAGLQVALKAVNATRYYWQDPEREGALRAEMASATASYYPKAQLIYTPTTESLQKKARQYRLAYRYEINAVTPSGQWAVYVDATNGQTIKKVSLRDNCYDGTVTTVYNGVQTIQTDQRPYAPYNYLLEDWCRGAVIASKYANTNDPCWSCLNYIYWGSNNSWNNTTESMLTASAHWSMEKAHDYFASLGRSNNNIERRVQVDHPDNGYDTFYTHSDSDNKDYFHIGRYGQNSLAELDIVAHEFAHSVTRITGVLGNAQESGALNESFSDIFGLMTERTVYGNIDWVLGSRAGAPRSFANTGPSLSTQAQYYQGTGSGWQDVYNPYDNGGVHINCGVQNRWFYLLSVGGAGSRGPLVPAIGPDKAARIAYAALTGYLFQYANYPDSRAATIQAATNIYGACSLEVEAVTKAWYGVGVGDPFPTVCASAIQGPISYCLENGPSVYQLYTVQASAGAVKTWSCNNPDWGFSQVGEDFELTYVPDYVSSATVTVVIAINGTSTTKTKKVSTRQCSLCKCPVQRGVADASEETKKAASADFVVFPNPATQAITLGLPVSGSDLKLVATDALGREWLTQTVTAGVRTLNLNVSGMPAGVYQLHISNGEWHTTRRFQVIK
ncbi:M4 family metallopeptidase [Hymenobacter ruricola]|uniref:M4 family metallopeptidase n=1 Tax=Hymenobacter ruricola TaxID=2791023 RepID=A0ABS0I4D9_9BACT|nr:M4 family metallopeptidase [Hymenobacter ruricola]MBF9221414.1 M4 family metallopeptidase [Hymenobacter ruricola]